MSYKLIKSPFKPSIKFDPFIKINKQNDVKNILKFLFLKDYQKKLILDDNISKSKKITEKKIIII